MTKSNNIFKRIQKWYRSLFIEYPEDYGDPMSSSVEEFNAELKETKDDKTAKFGEEHATPGQQGKD